MYTKALAARGMRVLEPDAEDQEKKVMAAIYLIKTGAGKAQAEDMLAQAAANLVKRGAQVIVLGCTETPLAFNPKRNPVPTVDATLVLAQAAVSKHRELSAAK
jgi:aspartate racemase